ncbi:hypothetical protein KC19_4G196800 [Ceratodon purpureus]|uniref:Uncharacterized protein n=1 Tax=Ceratodon purpureus TaxID=3225 RepID=A0A8T0IAN5_CERPU|nr:hypothetical protein KC19_4G196800 [Ceratodon purpureus]
MSILHYPALQRANNVLCFQRMFQPVGFQRTRTEKSSLFLILLQFAAYGGCDVVLNYVPILERWVDVLMNSTR